MTTGCFLKQYYFGTNIDTGTVPYDEENLFVLFVHHKILQEEIIDNLFQKMICTVRNVRTGTYNNSYGQTDSQKVYG